MIRSTRVRARTMAMATAACLVLALPGAGFAQESPAGTAAPPAAAVAASPLALLGAPFSAVFSANGIPLGIGYRATEVSPGRLEEFFAENFAYLTTCDDRYTFNSAYLKELAIGVSRKPVCETGVSLSYPGVEFIVDDAGVVSAIAFGPGSPVARMRDAPFPAWIGASAAEVEEALGPPDLRDDSTLHYVKSPVEGLAARISFRLLRGAVTGITFSVPARP